MNPNEVKPGQLSLRDRLFTSWFPPAAVAGAFTAFITAAFRFRPDARTAPRATEPAAGPPGGQAGKPVQPHGRLDRQYTLIAVLGGASSADPFRRSLVGIDAGAGDRIFVLGDDEVRIYDAAGNIVRRWKPTAKAGCLAAGSDGRVCVGANNLVEVYDADGSRVGGFAAGDAKAPARITAIKIYGQEILVADADARVIRRYDMSGRQLGLIGTENKTGSFILPNKSLDFDVDAKGVVHATDTGRHQVTAWAIGGSPLGKFGKFGMANPEDFVGCCNPVNLAIAPDGRIVTAEKMISRVKVYEPDGKLLAVIGPENFDPNCVHIHLAVDSKGRILTADPVRREIKIFSLITKAGNRILGELPSPADGKLEEITRA
jgi:hypothetical protein